MTISTSISSRTIPATSLDPAAFAAFGEVVQNPSTHNGSPASVQKVTANQGSADKYLDVTHMQNWYELSQSKKPARSVVNMFSCKPRELERSAPGKIVFPVRILERHPFTPQTFVPLGLDPEDKSTCYLVIVAPTLPLQSRNKEQDGLAPAYPVPPLRRKRSLRERLLGARPNPFTNDFVSRTTPANTSSTSQSTKPKGPGLPDLDNLRAFIARGDQAVTYGPGTWHAPMVVLGRKPIDFVVVQYANGVGVEDCQEVEILPSDGGEGLAADVSDALEQSVDIRAKL